MVARQANSLIPSRGQEIGDSIQVAKPVVGQVKSAARTIELLELLAREPKPLTLSQIALRLSMPVSSVHQLVNTLVSRGWLTASEAGGYTIGVQALMTGMAFLQKDPLVQDARPILSAIRNELGETVHLARLEGARVVYLISAESEKQLRTVTRVGQSLPAHATALGKAILATFDDDELCDLLPVELERLMPRTIVDRGTLITNLDEVRTRGWSIEQEENTLGTACVGVSIPYAPGRYAISCSVPLLRLSDDRISQVVQTLQLGVQSLMQKFSH